MPMNTLCLASDGEQAVHALQDAIENLDSAGSELVLDFSSVNRIDAQTLAAMESLGSRAVDKGVKVVLRNVNVGVYKTLKLTNVAQRFSFEQG